MNVRRGVLLSCLAATLPALAPGCSVRCGPVQTVPPQKLHVIAAMPTAYVVRVVTGEKKHIDTSVPPDGRVAFDVPVSSRLCTPYLFGVIKVGWPTPVEERRVIWVMRGERTVHKLSARNIARLPADAEDFHELRME